MSSVLNLTQYMKLAYAKKAMFVTHETGALHKGDGMCFNLDYVTTATGETATDGFGQRGLKEIQIPRSSNNNAFAGVLAQNYPANPNGFVRMIELALPGSCAMISQRVASTINTGLVTCVVGENDAGAVTGVSGKFGHGGFMGLGSAIPLETLTAATGGDLAFQNILGTATSVYDSGTGLTTITLTGAGTALGYLTEAIAADGYECTVWGGATASDSTAERCPSGVFTVYQATGANTFTVTGDTGDGALTVNLVIRDFLTLAYLCDGPETGLSTYYIPETASVVPPVIDSGMIICLGGLTMAADCEPVINDGTIDGQLLGFYQLATLVTKEMLLNITSGFTLSGSGIAGSTLATIEFNTAGEWASLVWRQFGPATTGAWQLTGLSDTGIVPA